MTPWHELPRQADAVVVVGHQQYLDQSLTELLASLKPGDVFIDIKSAFDPYVIFTSGCNLWRL